MDTASTHDQHDMTEEQIKAEHGVVDDNNDGAQMHSEYNSDGPDPW